MTDLHTTHLSPAALSQPQPPASCGGGRMSLRDKLLLNGWVTNFNVDTLVKLIEDYYMGPDWMMNQAAGLVPSPPPEIAQAIYDALKRAKSSPSMSKHPVDDAISWTAQHLLPPS